MPAHEGLGLDDRDHPQDRRKPAIQLDQEQAIAARELDTSPHLPPQHDQMPEHGILCFKSTLRLKRRSERASKKHSSAIIADDVRRFCHQINTDGVFGTHNRFESLPQLRQLDDLQQAAQHAAMPCNMVRASSRVTWPNSSTPLTILDAALIAVKLSGPVWP